MFRSVVKKYGGSSFVPNPGWGTRNVCFPPTEPPHFLGALFGPILGPPMRPPGTPVRTTFWNLQGPLVESPGKPAGSHFHYTNLLGDLLEAIFTT